MMTISFIDKIDKIDAYYKYYLLEHVIKTWWMMDNDRWYDRDDHVTKCAQREACQ